MTHDQEPVYPMMVVERMTGLTRRQIRYWEHHGLFCVTRTQGGHRLFSREDVNLLLQIKSIRKQGVHSLDTVRRILDFQAQENTLRRSRGNARYQPGGRRGTPANLPRWSNSDARAHFDRHEILSGRRERPT